MGLTSGGGGDDRLQVGLAVFAIVVSLVVTSLVPAIVPEYDADGDALADARQKMENFTGESMVSNSPWQLTSVRTPYTANEQTNAISEYGWVYGSISTSYTLDGTSYIDKEVVRLDPSKKSAVLLKTGEEGQAMREQNIWYYADNAVGDFVYWVVGGIGDLFGADISRTETVVVSGKTFDFTGYMYHFDPTYRISTQGSSVTKKNSDMASLNIVWYDTGSASGISGGLVLQSDKTEAIIANYSAVDIIANVSEDSQYATKYLLNFDGIQVYMYILFDNDVVTSQTGYSEAWAQGRWTIAFSSPSADGLMDIFNSNDLASSMGSLIDTYISIFTFNMPNCPTAFKIIFWVVCVLPIELCLIMFLSRFGIVGMGLGVAASALAFVGVS